jgi:hypothetical protein
MQTPVHSLQVLVLQSASALQPLPTGHNKDASLHVAPQSMSLSNPLSIVSEQVGVAHALVVPVVLHHPFVQSAFDAQVVPSGQSLPTLAQALPQSVAISLPFNMPSLQVAARQVLLQDLLTQSVVVLQVLPSAHAGHTG